MISDQPRPLAQRSSSCGTSRKHPANQSQGRLAAHIFLSVAIKTEHSCQRLLLPKSCRLHIYLRLRKKKVLIMWFVSLCPFNRHDFAIPKFFSFSFFGLVQGCCRAQSPSGSTDKTAGRFLDFLWRRRPRARQTKEGKPCQVSPPQAGLVLPSPPVFPSVSPWRGSVPKKVWHNSSTSAIQPEPLHSSIHPCIHPSLHIIPSQSTPDTPSSHIVCKAPTPTHWQKNRNVRCVNQLLPKNARAIFYANFSTWKRSNLTLCLFDSEHATTETLYLFDNTVLFKCVSLSVCTLGSVLK